MRPGFSCTITALEIGVRPDNLPRQSPGFTKCELSVSSCCATAVAPKRRIVEPDQADLPCPVPCRKIFRFRRRANQIYDSRHPVPTEGRFAIVTDVGRDAVDADGAADEGAGCGRQSRVVLTPRRWSQAVACRRRWQKSPVTGEST